MCLRCTSAASLYARVCAHVLLPPKMTAMMMLMKMTMTIASWQIGDGCSVSCCANKVLTTPIHMFACTYVCVCADVFMKMLSTKVLQARTRPPLEQSRCPERVAKQGVQLAALFVCVCVCVCLRCDFAWHVAFISHLRATTQHCSECRAIGRFLPPSKPAFHSGSLFAGTTVCQLVAGLP